MTLLSARWSRREVGGPLGLRAEGLGRGRWAAAVPGGGMMSRGQGWGKRQDKHTLDSIPDFLPGVGKSLSLTLHFMKLHIQFFHFFSIFV